MGTRSKQEIQKDLLDAEMELFNSEHDQTQDQTKDLQEKVFINLFLIYLKRTCIYIFFVDKAYLKLLIFF